MKIKEETELIEGEVVEIEIDRPASGQLAKTVSERAVHWQGRRPAPLAWPTSMGLSSQGLLSLGSAAGRLQRLSQSLPWWTARQMGAAALQLLRTEQTRLPRGRVPAVLRGPPAALAPATLPAESGAGGSYLLRPCS